MSWRRGHLLLAGLLLFILTVQIDRVFFATEEGPVFFVREPGNVIVELGTGFPKRHVHQIFDGSSWRDVIKLTDARLPPDFVEMPSLDATAREGQRIDLDVKNNIIKGLSISWLPAAKRVSMGIPLHPDRMSLADWDFLPGVGEKMALKIDNNRQKYGEFGSFSALQRVPGIGKKRLTSWNQYFFPNNKALTD